MFYDNLKAICDEKGLKVTPIVLECGGTKGVITGWKRGSSPNSEMVAKLSARLGVSCDRLILGNNYSGELLSVSESNVGAIGNNSNGTIQITEQIKEGASICPDDEATFEVLRILRELPLRERLKLLSIIFDYEDDYKKRGSK